MMSVANLEEGIQYKVILRQREIAETPICVWAPREQIQKIFNDYNPDDSDVPHEIWMGHIAQNNTKYNDPADTAEFNRKDLGSLVFRCRDEESANRCAGYLKLPLPFPKAS